MARTIDDLPAAAAQQLRGTLQLLAAIFGEPAPKLSDLLAEEGLTPAQISILKTHLLEGYLEELTRTWISFFEDVLPENHALVLRRRYGLDGHPPPTLQALGEQLGLSRERIRQLQKSAVSRLRGPKRRERLRIF